MKCFEKMPTSIHLYLFVVNIHKHLKSDFADAVGGLALAVRSLKFALLFLFF